MRYIIPISGKDSLATAIVQSAMQPELNYEYIYNDTMMELPETYAWLELVEKTLAIKINRIGKSLEQVIYEEGMLPSQQARFCTRKSKIHPMNDWIGKEDSTIYIGIRHDEKRAGLQTLKNQTAKYPLKENHVDLKSVYAICESKNLMPPTFFWQRMFDQVVKIVGCTPEAIRQELPRYVFDRAFAWRSRPNCFMCFYQRRYEWIGLSEFHPDLFAKAMEIEDWAAKDRRENAFYWVQDMPLRKLREKSNHYFKKRAEALAQMISKKLQRELWSDSLFDEMEMAQKSCGLFCGK